MSDGIYTALSGAVAQGRALDATAENLANITTEGYQRLRPVFHEVMAQATRTAGRLHDTVVSSQELDGTMGAVRQTGRSLDVSLPAGRYLAVQTPQGERYTRAGSLQVGADGGIITRAGHAVLGDDGAPLRIDRAQGEAVMNGQGELTQGSTVLGRLKVVQFQRAGALAHEGATVLAATQQSGAAQAAPSSEVTPATIEDSNASAVVAMNELVNVTRTFEAFQRAIDAFREADRRAASTLIEPTK